METVWEGIKRLPPERSRLGEAVTVHNSAPHKLSNVPVTSLTTRYSAWMSVHVCLLSPTLDAYRLRPSEEGYNLRLLEPLQVYSVLIAGFPACSTPFRLVKVPAPAIQSPAHWKNDHRVFQLLVRGSKR